MKYKLQDIIDIAHFQSLQERLNEIYAFPSSIIDNEGNILTAVGWQDVCTQFHRKNKESAAACTQSDQYILSHLNEASPTVTYHCPHRLVDTATPIFIDGIHYGNFFIGQFFLKEPDLNFFRAQTRKYGFNETAYLDAIRKVPVWTQTQLDNYLFLIKGLIAVISEIGLKNLREFESRRKIRESEDRLHLTLDNIPNSYVYQFTYGTGGKPEFLFISDSVEKLHPDVRVENVLADADTLLSRIGPAQTTAFWQQVDASARSMTDFSMDLILDNPESGPHCLHIQSRPRKDGQGRIIWDGAVIDISERVQNEEALRISEIRNRRILQTTMDGYFRMDRQGRILEANPAYCDMSGYEAEELLSMNIIDLTEAMASGNIESNILKVMENGKARFESRHRRRDGSLYDVEISAQMLEENGNVQFVSFLRDITQRKKQEEVRVIKLRLLDYAPNHSVTEFLQKFLDEAERLTESQIGFFHFVDEDQEMLSLQTWSTNTLKNMCTAEGTGSHYPISQAGVWVDCVKVRQPVVHNDYEGLQQKKGLPPGHAPILREMVVPVIRDGKIVAILGVGNKKNDYTADDTDIVQQLANLSWETVVMNRAEEGRHESEERYRAMMEAMSDGAYICSPGFRIEYANPAMIRQIGEAAVGDYCYRAIHGLEEKCPWCCMDKIQNGKGAEVDIQGPKDGRFYHISASPLFHPNGSTSKMAIYRDVTQQKRAEGQLRQAQKLESIGNLAAGIAHDFNNILFPIIGLSELLLEDLPPENLHREHAVEIFNSARRAADLVAQILTFSRQGERQRIPIRIQQVLKEVYKLMRTTIPSNIPVKQSIRPDCRPVMADPTQVHQIAMNLLTNAYHAVEENGGEIVLELEERTLTGDESPGSALPPGEYAVLSVSDTGRGIDPRVVDRIFEPYFSTKAQGKGTGLGLSTVYGIVREHEGEIRITNKPEEGVRFDVFFPILKTTPEQKADGTMKNPLPSGNERILLVDDEEAIVRLGGNILQRLGYRVATFTDAREAQKEFHANAGAYDLVISDMAMPHITGVQLAESLRSIRPDIPIIICTGFSEKIDKEKAAEIGIQGLLMKPMGRVEMATMVRSVLDAAPHGKQPPGG